MVEYKLSELEEKLSSAYSLLDELKEDRDVLRAQLETLKEQQAKAEKGHTPKEEPQPTPVFDCIHREERDGEIFCKKYGQVVSVCTTRCFSYKPRGDTLLEP